MDGINLLNKTRTMTSARADGWVLKVPFYAFSTAIHSPYSLLKMGHPPAGQAALDDGQLLQDGGADPLHLLHLLRPQSGHGPPSNTAPRAP
jgi:hypothetical protein